MTDKSEGGVRCECCGKRVPFRQIVHMHSERATYSMCQSCKEAGKTLRDIFRFYCDDYLV